MRHHGRQDGGQVWSLTVKWLSNGMMAGGMLPSASLMPVGPALALPQRTSGRRSDRASDLVSDLASGRTSDPVAPQRSHAKRGVACSIAGRATSGTDATIVARRSAAIVKVLDRASEHTVVVSWCDSQGGHFGDQTWRLASAKKRGVCAMTGRAIEKGDAVYRPWLREKARSNANERILAECVDAALRAQALDD